MKAKKKLISILLTVSMMLTMFPFAAFAQDANDTGNVAESAEIVLPEGRTADSFKDGNTVYYDGQYYKTLVEALKAAAGVEGAKLYCKPGAKVGPMTHGHVCASMTVYGNDAWVEGGENEFEVDTYKGNSCPDHKACLGIQKELTLTINNLNNSGVWGQRTSNHTINVVMNNCKNAERVYISNDTGATCVTNITINGNTYNDDNKENPNHNIKSNCAIYSNAQGTIQIDNCQFEDVPEPINLNHKSAGVQNITVSNTKFHNCATSDIMNKDIIEDKYKNEHTYASNIRVLSTAEGGSSVVNVKNCTFTYDEGKEKANGDILLGDGRFDGKIYKNATLSIVNTAADVQMQKPGYYKTATGTDTDDTKLQTATVAESDQPTTLSVVEAFAVAKVGDIYYDSFEEAVEKASVDATVTLLKDVITDKTIEVDKNITIDGNGKSITRTTDGMVMNVKYGDGTNVAVKNLVFKGNNPGGLLEWSIKNGYKDIDAPAVTPKLSVTGCTFSSDDGAQTGAGIGFWGYSTADWSAKAKSEVVVDSCTFDTLSAGIYYNEEAPLMNLKSTVTNNSFKNLSWTGIAGIPANAEIAHNTFEESCGGAIQYLFNAEQTTTATTIHDNVINSKKGIQFMPYHLNENNANGNGQDVEITAAMLPDITKNVRHTDTNLVEVVGYRAGSDEQLVFAKDTVLDLNENYTQGKAPTITVVVQTASAGNTAPEVDSVTPPVKNDVYYEADTMQPEDLNTYEPPVVVTRYDVIVSDTDNGTITATHKRASKNSTVTITATPDEGYVVDAVTVTEKDGDKVEVTKKDDNKYTFKMPASDVTVKATFKVAPTEPEQPTGLPFTDVAKDAWYFPAVEYVFNNGLMNGTTATTFAPNVNLNRAMMAAVLYNMEGKPVCDKSGLFSDVADGKWYTDAVNWAASNNIVSGMPDGTYAPNQALTREQMASILYRYAEYKGIDTDARADLGKFTDGNTTSAWATDVVQWAVAEKLINGVGTELQPKGTASRAQVATVLMNYCENVAK